MHGLFIPPVSEVAQHGVAIMQSIMQFIGHAQHGLQLKQQGFMHGIIIFMFEHHGHR